MRKGTVSQNIHNTTRSSGKSHQATSNEVNSTESNQIQVYGIGDIFNLPDQVKISIHISSSKAKADDSKNSVKRRYDYVIQCIGNLHLKQSDVYESSSMKKQEGGYCYTTTITVTFNDFKKCQNLCNLLEEKLDNAVVISAPSFSNSKTHLDQLRKKVSMLAVENARTKAVEIANHVGNRLFRPLWLREEEFSEILTQSDTSINTIDTAISDQWERSMNAAAVSVHAKVAACFEMGSLRTGDQPKH